ncbi:MULTISPECIES: ABC transporter permease subunit [Cyanophyceae]|uniref:PhnE/PtxC family ABC transporter permease n=1 Tax=Cyanophyceae TaxID=3028117 RepID=UPI001686D018|nr:MULTISPECIES: ABC transporter permease subunit [Cyanophyceae]MBD1918502.1 ABC transporter permease subunit [Phormidium sp. FACHB-77]MBD2031391.1 ABC transporter permease subunit [Phormidium sp. FACHB-322]MBD2049511.1 ABC transporter permease subunit [Leptolyngbya sp. FACHB-60]
MVNTQQTITIPLRPSLWNPKTASAFGVLAALALAAYQAGLGRPGIDLINLGGWPQLREFLAASLRPDLSPEFVALMGRAALVTLAYAVLGTALSVGLGIVGGLLSSAVWWQTVFPGEAGGLRRGIWLGVRGLLAFPRAIHELIWGLVLLQVLGLNPLVGVLAIAIPFGAIVAKVFSEILDETPPEPLHALLNAGAPPLTAFVYGLLPQALPNLLSYTFYRFECSLRASAVLGIIGAGGLGYEIFLSLQSLRYEQLWTGFYALIVLNGAVDAWSAVVRRRMGFTSRLDINRKPGNTSSRPALKALSQDWFLRLSWMGAILAVPLSWWWLRLDIGVLWSTRTQRLLGELLSTGWPPLPTWAEVVNLARLSWLTVAMSMVAIALAGLFGILFSLPAAQNFLLPGGLLRPVGQRGRSAWVSYTLLGLSRLVLLISRAIPAPIWALVLLYMLFPGVLPGALALALHNFGILGRLMAEVNENLDDRPVRALSTLGANPSAIVAYGILPQNLGRFLAYILYRWEVCLRETVIVGLVGAGGLGRLLTEQISSFDYSGVMITLGVFVVLTFGVDAVSQRLRGILRE